MKKLLCFSLLMYLFAAVPLACASSLDDDDDMLEDAIAAPSDPLEPVNRVVHRFNDVILDYVARPVYDGYAYVTPRFVRTGIKNAYYNALFPVRFTNNLLQGKGHAAGVEFSRFFLNTTAGIGGLIDVAKYHKPIVPVDEEDFGQTLGVWGIGDGVYLVLPFLGPSTLRDTVGKVGDHFLDPLTYVSPVGLQMGLKGGRTLNQMDDILDVYDDMNRSAVEPYSAFRNAYLQHRKAKVAK